MYKLYIRLQNYYQVFFFFFWSHCVARRNTIKLLSGSDRGNQKSLVLQNVINVPGVWRYMKQMQLTSLLEQQ